MLIPSGPFLPSEYRVKPVTEAWELREALALRRQVFCGEQRIFPLDDHDALDRHAITLVAVSCLSGMPEQVVGTVRIHALRGPLGHWQGSRLAVLAAHRRTAWLGSALIRLAVGMARARGAQRFTARVQARNVALFEHLHWRPLAAIELFGHPHRLMEADLAHYPPLAGERPAVIACSRLAA